MSIPDRTEEWKPREAPDFVRFYMGKSISNSVIQIMGFQVINFHHAKFPIRDALAKAKRFVVKITPKIQIYLMPIIQYQYFLYNLFHNYM